jgi:hypothetical protein
MIDDKKNAHIESAEKTDKPYQVPAKKDEEKVEEPKK